MKTKTQKIGMLRKAFRVVLPAMMLSAMSVSAQTSESMGTVTGTTTVAAHEAANGFDVDGVTYTASGADVRNTNPSVTTDYAAASGAANIFIDGGESFTISNFGTNSCSGSLITMTFGLRKSTNASDGSNMIVEYSTNGGISWTGLSFTALPTGTGTSRWYERTVSGLPATCNLQLRFRSNAAPSGVDFRIDDVRTSCGDPVESLCDATITANDTNVFCFGDSVRLTANPGDSYLWSNGATTQSILVQNSGTYSVIVEDDCCFATSTGFYVLVHGDNGYNPVSASVDNDTVCPGDSVTLSVRTNTRALYFSKYEEGSGVDKALEIYNGTGAAVLLSDFEIRNFHNGACDNSIPTYTIALPAIMLADGAVFTVANPGHSQIGGCFNPDLQSNDIQFNGDDAVTLYNAASGEYVDIIGSICNDPGSNWRDTGFYRTEDILLTRRPCVYEGILVNPNLPGIGGFPTLVSEWLRDTIPSACSFGTHTHDANLYTWTPQPTVPATGSVVRALPAGTTTYFVDGSYCDECPYTDSVRVVVEECIDARKAAPAVNGSSMIVNAEAYPNPFTDNVTLNITTLENGPVKVEIVNMLGETVAVLNNSVMAAGKHTITWNGGESLPAGVYSCKVTTGNAVQTVMLVKSAK
jgi:hypothetical protein